jgi:hypothetical protein
MSAVRETGKAARREALARAILHVVRRAIVDPRAIDVVLAGDGPPAGAGRAPAGTSPVGGRPADIATSGAGPALEIGRVPGLPGAGPLPRAIVVVGGPDALGRLLFPPSPDAFAVGYLRGDLDIDRDVMAAAEAGQALDLRRLRARDVRRVARWGWELRRGAARPSRLARVARMTGQRHSRARDMAAVRFHYDVGNAFFALGLDREPAGDRPAPLPLRPWW